MYAKLPRLSRVRSVQNRIRAKADNGDFRPQDIPRIVAVRVGAEGVPRLTIAKVLNHAEPGIASGYDRSSRDPEEQQALDTWGRRLMMIFSGPEECDASVNDQWRVCFEWWRASGPENAEIVDYHQENRHGVACNPSR
jgi:hypothetical protein